MQPGAEVAGVGHAERVIERARQRERLFIRAAARAGYPSIHSVMAAWVVHETPESCRAETPRTDWGYGFPNRTARSLLEMGERSLEVARVEGHAAQRIVGREKWHGIRVASAMLKSWVPMSRAV